MKFNTQADGVLDVGVLREKERVVFDTIRDSITLNLSNFDRRSNKWWHTSTTGAAIHWPFEINQNLVSEPQSSPIQSS